VKVDFTRSNCQKYKSGENWGNYQQNQKYRNFHIVKKSRLTFAYQHGPSLLPR